MSQVVPARYGLNPHDHERFWRNRRYLTQARRARLAGKARHEVQSSGFEVSELCRTERYVPWLRQDRIVMWQHRWYVPLLLSGLALPFLAGYVYNGWMGGVGCFLLAGAGRIFLVLNSTFCINSVCHLWGSQPYSRSNSSRDCWWVSLITLGEGYHNYHHTFPRDYRNGPLWYNVDPSKWLIYALSKLGLAEGLVRCDSGSRARIRPRNPALADIGNIAGERVAAANPRLQENRS